MVIRICSRRISCWPRPSSKVCNWYMPLVLYYFCFETTSVEEREDPILFISAVPVLPHAKILLHVEPAGLRSESNPIESTGTIDLHWISWTSRRRLGHLLLGLRRGRPGRHERNFGRLECQTLWWCRRRTPIAALHVLELPHLPAVFVSLLSLAPFAEVEI